MEIPQLKTAIETLDLSQPISNENKVAIELAVSHLDQGSLSVVSFEGDQVVVNQWVKKAILGYFKIHDMRGFSAGDLNFCDKVPVKAWEASSGVRVVPPAVARYGSYIEKGAVLMPSYVNIGARVGAGTMVDTWATVGSCAWIGKNVHLSGGVGIGGVLEPLQAQPVVIEDDVFVGSRCIIVEGVRVRKGAVIGAGVVLTGSSLIVDVRGSEPKEWRGEIPERAVVIPGTREKKFPAGNYQIPCALIISERSASTDLKTSLNQILRDIPT